MANRVPADAEQSPRQSDEDSAVQATAGVGIHRGEVFLRMGRFDGASRSASHRVFGIRSKERAKRKTDAQLPMSCLLEAIWGVHGNLGQTAARDILHRLKCLLDLLIHGSAGQHQARPQAENQRGHGEDADEAAKQVTI